MNFRRGINGYTGLGTVRGGAFGGINTDGGMAPLCTRTTTTTHNVHACSFDVIRPPLNPPRPQKNHH